MPAEEPHNYGRGDHEVPVGPEAVEGADEPWGPQRPLLHRMLVEEAEGAFPAHDALAVAHRPPQVGRVGLRSDLASDPRVEGVGRGHEQQVGQQRHQPASATPFLYWSWLA